MASNNYVLAEYNGETRKIPGEWSRKSYKNLIKEVRSKFNIQFNDISIKVYDKKNKTYFSIDKYEMNEIPKGGLIKIDRGKKTTTSSNNNNNNMARSKKKGQAPMIPPGVPPYSKEDDAKRNGWKMGSKVEIYSEGQAKWQKGEVVRIFNDNEGEWLVIKYAGFRTKEIQRFSNYIRPIQPQKQKKQKPPKQSQQATKGEKSNGNNKGKQMKEGEKAKPAKKEKKPPKITTQSKYKRKPRVPEKTQFAENEIYFTNNVRHIKKYIDRACMLLSGSDASHEHHDVVRSAQSEDDDDEKEDEHAQSEEEDEEIHMVDMADLEKPPSKKYNVIHMFAAGRSMAAVVRTTEIVKRIVTGLYQVTTLEAVEIKDTWLPTEEGLKEVEVVRNVPRLKITLATSPEFVDKEAAGYQEPITNTEFASSIQYHYPDESGRGRGRGRGRTRGRGRGKGGSTSGRGRGRGN